MSQVSVLVEFELRGCTDVACEKTFVINKYETPMLSSAEARNITRFQRVARVATGDNEAGRQNTTIEINFNTNENGFYLAIVDETTCIGITRVIVFYNVCPAGAVDLVNRTETLAPRIERISQPFEISLQCVDGASPEDGQSAKLNCNQGGVWSSIEGAGCRCNPGLVLSEDGQSCVEGTYMHVIG